jgi:hypothetical protein
VPRNELIQIGADFFVPEDEPRLVHLRWSNKCRNEARRIGPLEAAHDVLADPPESNDAICVQARAQT